ncbi:GtrA family protein [Phytohabitans sp. ZYX-F-186]|uniref:GtrA family protein n=1 Tax=Phytohabitans maris TaxID=3071409 RepID=A0ABU0ZCE6_9ACTN|nr:GtrA family protein [Phytohabitans sp. ZYX-F-186]MDQ7904726.1 GtrA family protein [Phytohabitans sp. ZYX-F-186]
MPRFLLLAGVGFTFDLTLLTLLHRLTPLPNAVSVTLAFWATYALNFALNRHVAFRAHGHAVGPQLARFVPQVLGDYVLTLTAVLALQALGLNLTVARIVAGGTNLVFNYVLYRWWTFRRRPRTAVLPTVPIEAPREASSRRPSPVPGTPYRGG